MLLTRKHFVQGLFLAIICVLFLGSSDSRFNDLGHKMMCKCGCSQVLLECNHVGCTYSDRMREELTAALERGDSDDLVMQAFVQKYGATVLAAPTTKGFNRVAWIMPFAVFGMGIIAVVYVVKVWKARQPAANATAVPLTNDVRERIRKDTEI